MSKVIVPNQLRDLAEGRRRRLRARNPLPGPSMSTSAASLSWSPYSKREASPPTPPAFDASMSEAFIEDQLDIRASSTARTRYRDPTSSSSGWRTMRRSQILRCVGWDPQGGEGPGSGDSAERSIGVTQDVSGLRVQGSV